MKKSGVYEIINTVTDDFYIGSTIDLKRWRREHFNENYWKHNPNKQLYKDMKQYGKNNFLFKTIQLCETDELKKYEQIAIEKYNPQYNICAAYTGLSKEEYQKKYNKQYYKENTDKIKQYRKQQCLYENEILSLGALSKRFSRQGIEHPVLEAKKYLIGE